MRGESSAGFAACVRCQRRSAIGNVMRVRSAMIILGAATLFLVALVLLSAPWPPARAPIGIGVLSYQPWAGTGLGPGLMVRVGITNRGFKTIKYDKLSFDGGAQVLMESESGWTQRDIGPFARVPFGSALLESGADTSACILLPEGTRRWQISYMVYRAGMRESVLSRIPPRWRSRVPSLFARLLSNKEGWQEVRSAVFECPHDPKAGSEPLGASSR